MQQEFNQVRECLIQQEERGLYPHAAFSQAHSRFIPEKEDHRLPYKRDVDRIIHSKAYRRYVDKTQVVYLVDNDHVTHRGLHVQLVSNFSRGLAQVLRLNTDLVEAIALGHDVGHPPFGHEGEGYLSEIAIEWGLGAFCHSRQSCRLLRKIEPLNLGFAVYDGFLCHDGAMASSLFSPNFHKDWKVHEEEYNHKLLQPEANFAPATLEGCLVKLCDTVSYIGKDLEDAISLNLIHRDDVPRTPLGTSNSEILTYIAQDIVENSYDQPYIALSDGAREGLKVLRKFNFEKVYQHPALKVESVKIRNSYRTLAFLLKEEAEVRKEDSYLWKYFVHNKSDSYLSSSSIAQQVVDYIAGMTDNHFLRTLEKLFLPQKIELKHAFTCH